MKRFKVYAYHKKGYDLSFDPLYLTSKGVESFRKEFESNYPTQYITKTDDGYELESYIVIKIKEYHEPVFKDILKIDKINVSDEGYEETWLDLELV